MSSISDFLRLVDSYRAATQLADATVSTRVLKDGKRIKKIRIEGQDMGTRTLASAVQWFSDNWPPNHPWPASVPRPERERVAS